LKTHAFQAVYGVDINATYLRECQRRYPEWKEVFIPIEAYLLDERIQLPHCDLLIANLLVEYIGYTRFQTLAKQSSAVWIRVVIQQDFAKALYPTLPICHPLPH
jgi:hypothetical protein